MTPTCTVRCSFFCMSLPVIFRVADDTIITQLCMFASRCLVSEERLNEKPQTLALYMEAARKEMNLSGNEFADRAGVSRKTMHRILSGHIPDPDKLVTIAEHLHLDPLNLLGLAYLPPTYSSRKSILVREAMNLLDKMPDQLLVDMMARIRFEFDRYLKSISS